MDFKNKAELIEMATKEKIQNEFQCISVGISKKTKKTIKQTLFLLNTLLLKYDNDCIKWK